MSNVFERELPAFRLVNTRRADDLQAVAARELGDANRWVELVWLNRLVPPYLTDDPERVADGVILTGALVKVPSAVGLWSDGVVDEKIYERDIALRSRRLTVDADGDLSVFFGVDNLKQQLTHRIVTPTGQARRHGDYGCLVWRLVGNANSPLLGALGAEYVRGTLASDYRVSSVEYSRSEIQMDVTKITASVIAIAGGTVDVVVGQGGR